MSKRPSLDIRGALAILAVCGAFALQFYCWLAFGAQAELPAWVSGTLNVILLFYFVERRDERRDANGNGHGAKAPAPAPAPAELRQQETKPS